MQAILERLIQKIEQADIDPLPSDNIYMNDVFESEIYAEIIKRLPPDSAYQYIDHPDAVLPDGRRTRQLIDLTEQTIQTFPLENQAFWRDLHAVTTSNALLAAIIKKFSARIHLRFGNNIPEMKIVPIFYRDHPGYFISEHTDAPIKIATMQFYFAKDESQTHLGTSFHLKKPKGFQLLKTNVFKPNAAYAFVRTDESWHSVKQMAAHEKIRDTLALTVYIKGQEYQSKTYI